MIESVATMLIVLWVLALVSGYTLNGFIHVLVIIGIMLFVIRLIAGPAEESGPHGW